MLNANNKRKISRLGALLLIVISKNFSLAQTTAGQSSERQDTVSQAAATAVPFTKIDSPSTSRESIIPRHISARERAIPLRHTKTVKKVIGSLTTTGRTHVRRMLQRQPIYFPIVEEVLTRYGLPTDLKYLAVVESSLNAKAVSPVKAAGLWQFMPSVGMAYGLQQDAYVDERLDVEKATIAASCYLKVLHNMFGDWELALAAYNAGPGRVRRAIRRSGNRTSLAAISPFLPEETRNYVPTFVAISHVMSNHETYNIYPDTLDLAASFDTIQVDQPLSMALLAKNLNVPLQELRELNPTFKYNLIPAFVKKYTLRIPARAMGRLAEERQAILEAATPKLPSAQKQVLLAGNISSAIRLQASLMEVFTNKKKVTYQVTGTEAIKDIVGKYQVDATDIADWNYLKNHTLQAGQKLVLFVDPAGSEPSGLVTPETSVVASIEEIPVTCTIALEERNDLPKLVAKLPGDFGIIVASNQ